MPNILCFKLLKCEFWLLFYVLYHCELSIFPFWTVGLITSGSGNSKWPFFTISTLNDWKMNDTLIDNDNNLVALDETTPAEVILKHN